MNLPQPFVERMKSLLSTQYAAFEEALERESPTTIRLNPAKATTVRGNLERVPWAEGGYYLPQRHNFTFDPLFHAGAYYVQEASSMFVTQAIKRYVQEPVRYLDLCAAPGGKTTLALSVLPEGSLVVCNEPVRSRAHVLAENVIKWGVPNVVVTNNEPAAFEPLTHYFDVIATDVPCSGEGMFRKDPNAITEWSPANVAQCAARQRDILHTIWGALRPGGILIYSTCTYNTAENEEMVAHLQAEFGAIPLPLDTPSEWQISGALQGDAPLYRFMPHLTQGEGLFLAVLQKPADEPSLRTSLLSNLSKRAKKGKKGGAKENPLPLPKDLEQWFTTPELFTVVPQGERLYAFPKAYVEDLPLFASHNLLHLGIGIGELKGREVVPQHALALSTRLNRNYFASCEVDYDTALRYLRREALQLDSSAPRGMVLVTYLGYPLGWMKNLGNRANNLYPQEWRIRSGYQPQWEASPVVGEGE